MKLKEYINVISSDLFRYMGRTEFLSLIKCFIFIPGFRYSFLMRSAMYLKSCGLLLFPVYIVCRILLNHYQYKYGICIPYNTEIGRGLYIGHFGGIIVHNQAKIGRNCNINHDVTIGAAYGGKYPGVPVILDNVYLGPGSKIIGGIILGNHVAIGANCVVTKSIPDFGVVVGIPGSVISTKGSTEYVINTVS